MMFIGFDRFNLRAAGFPSPGFMLAPTARLKTHLGRLVETTGMGGQCRFLSCSSPD